MIAKCVTNVLTTLKFLTSSVIYYWTDAQQHGIYLFYVIKKQTITAFFISKSFYITQKPAFAPFGKHTKKPFDVICCCDWSRKIMPLSDLTLNGFLWNEDVQRKQNWTAKYTNVKENAGKIKSVFVISAGLQITAGQRTMSGQNWLLTGQISGWPDMSGQLPTC